MHRIVFLGPPGAGKGTQAAQLARDLGVPHLATGDLLRTAVAARSPLGLEAQRFMDAGQLVPDELVLKILGDRLSRPDASRGFILDGFPRNLAQAETLGRMTPLDAVLSFEIAPEELVRRLSNRRTCPKCQSVYNLASEPPKRPGLCDRDGTELVQRPDDRPEAVTTRFGVYAERTAPLLEHYRQKGLLRPIEASGSADEVAARVRAAVR
jgi:adenylate kinase